MTEKKKTAFDSLNAFDILDVNAFDDVQLPPEDKLLFSKELKTVVREEIGKLPIDELIATITEKALSSLEKPKDWAAEIKESQKELRDAIEESKKEKKEIVEKLKDKYAELRNDLLNRTQYQFGGFVPPSTSGHSGEFLTNNGAGLFSWATAGGSIGSTVGGVTIPYALLFTDINSKLAQDAGLTFDGTNFVLAPIGGGLLSFAGPIVNLQGTTGNFQFDSLTISGDVALSTAATPYSVLFINASGKIAQNNSGIAFADDVSNPYLIVNSGTNNPFNATGLWGTSPLGYKLENTSPAAIGNEGALSFYFQNASAASYRGAYIYGTQTSIGLGTENTDLGFFIRSGGSEEQLLRILGQTRKVRIGSGTAGADYLFEFLGPTHTGQIIWNDAGHQFWVSGGDWSASDDLAGSLGNATTRWINVYGQHFIGTDLTLTTPLAVAYGGTGAATYTNGQLLIGNTATTGLTVAALTGTANQVIVTNGNGTITLTTPQSIGTASNVQFSLLGLGTASAAGARLTLPTNTTSLAHIRMNPGGSLKTTPVAGDTEGNVDDLYYTITTSASRKNVVLADNALTTGGRLVFTTTNGRVSDNSGATFDGTNLTLASSLINSASGGGSTSGQTWNDTTQKSRGVYQSGVKQMLEATLFTQSATQTVANTVTETTIFGTGIGTLTLPANFFVAGKTIRITISGIYSTVAVTGDTVTIKIKYGSTVLATKATTSLLAGASNLYWYATADITCQTTGSSGTAMASGHVMYEISTAGGLALDELNNGAAATTINTTTSNTLDVTITHSAANASNSVKSATSTVQVIN